MWQAADRLPGGRGTGGPSPLLLRAAPLPPSALCTHEGTHILYFQVPQTWPELLRTTFLPPLAPPIDVQSVPAIGFRLHIITLLQEHCVLEAHSLPSERHFCVSVPEGPAPPGRGHPGFILEKPPR